jgi:glycosyltransferase involved in cell wall biosynthesis
METNRQALTVVICADHGSITGGQAKVAIDSALGLKQSGARVIFFAAAAPVDQRLLDAGVEVVCLGQTDLLGNASRAKAMLQGTWNGVASKALGDLLARLPKQNTIVHVHGWARALSPSIARPIAASGLPAIYTVHEYFLFCPNGGFYNYQKNEVCTLTPLSPSCLATHCDQINYPRKVWRNARLMLTERFAKLPQVFSAYVCLSNFQRGVIEQYLPRDARVAQISNPVDAPDLGEKENAASGEFLFVGRLSPEKGAFLFAEAARRLGLPATFIGDGPLKGELQARFPNARLLGWQSSEAVREALRAAKALVFPSLWYEGQPLTVLEAKALGTPVIVADQCAGRDEIEDGVSGLWFASGDAGALAAAMNQLSDPALLARMSRAAHNSYWEVPSTLERHVERLDSLYREMLSAGERAQGESRVSPACGWRDGSL